MYFGPFSGTLKARDRILTRFGSYPAANASNGHDATSHGAWGNPRWEGARPTTALVVLYHHPRSACKFPG